jgi:hypothetical protein
VSQPTALPRAPTTISTEYFKHAAHYPFFSSKCRLFHNDNFFDSCIIHILDTGVLKFKRKTPVQKQLKKALFVYN